MSRRCSCNSSSSREIGSYLDRQGEARKADKYTLEMVAIRYCFENILTDRAVVEGAQCQHFHRSFDNSSQTADTRKRDHILDVPDRRNPLDGVRWDRRSIHMAAVMVKATAMVSAPGQTHSHKP